MAKNGPEQKLIFWKNISSDLALVLRNYALWVNENDEIWSVAAFHEKFFTVPKLRFLAGPASLLDEVSTDTQNWPLRAVTTSNQSISVILQTFRPFLVIFGLFRSFLAILANFGLKFKIVAEYSCDHSKWPQEKQESDGDGFRCHFQTFRPFFGHLEPFLAIFVQFWPQIQNCCRLVMWPLKMTAREAEIQWRWFRMSLFRHSGQFRSFGALFGHFWPILALNSRWS